MKSITKGLKTLPRTRVDKIRWRGWPRQPTDKNPAKPHVFTDSCTEPALQNPVPRTIGTTFAFDDATVNVSTREVKRSGTSVFLTKKECETLKFLAQNAGRAVSRQDLLQRCNEGSLPARTIDQHTCNLRLKLEKDPAHPVHLLTVFCGYKFVP